MGVDTRGLIRPNTTESEVLEYLNNRFKNVKSFVTQDADRQVGFIGFEDGEDKRQLFFISKSYDEYKIENTRIDNTTYLSIGFRGNVIEIMKGFCEHFGEAIDENDCDVEDFYWVNKDAFFLNNPLTFEKELELAIGKQNFGKYEELVKKYNHE